MKDQQKSATPAQVSDDGGQDRWRELWFHKWKMFKSLYYGHKINVFSDRFVDSSLGLLSRDDVRYIVLNRLKFERAFDS